MEDSSLFREMQGLLLEKAGFAVAAYENPHAALAAAKQQHFDLVVIDYELPEMNGQQFMHALRAIQPEIAVIFVSGALTVDLAIELTSQGVAGIFNKPANPKNLLEKINETLFRHTVRDTAVRGESGSSLPGARGNVPASRGYVPPEPSPDECAYTPQFVLGSSPAFREFTHRLWKVRDFRAVLLLQGEPGSAFELFSRELAEISAFREGPVIFCPADQFQPRVLIQALAPSLLSPDAATLIVSGIESFTDAQQKTLEQLITGRDVFLPFARRFRLLLSATDQLSERVDDGTFDETLYYKVSAITVTVPPLRQMRQDIPANAQWILDQMRSETNGKTPAILSPEASVMLTSMAWRRNYAELIDCVRQAAMRATGNILDVDALRPENRVVAPPAPPEATPPPVFAVTPPHRVLQPAPPPTVSPSS